MDYAEWQARWSVRALAQAIDWATALLPGVSLFAAAMLVDPPGDGVTRDAGSLLVFLSLAAGVGGICVIPPALMARRGARNGQTLGKQLLGIRAVRLNGLPFDFGFAMIRETVMKALAGFITSGAYLVADALWPLADQEDRAVHDILAASRVLRADAPPVPSARRRAEAARAARAAERSQAG